jgi:hypothetical protein
MGDEMRRTATVVAAALPLLISGAAHAKFKSTSISIDNFCDVYTVSVQDKTLAAAVETDPDGTCNTFLGGGSIAKLKGLGRVAQIGGNFSSNASLVFVVDFQYPFVTGGAWNMYATSDGSVMQTITSGTYTVVTGAPLAGKTTWHMSDSTHR